MTKKQIAAYLVVLLLLVFYGAFLLHKTNLVTADLGRHIKNGETLLQDFSSIRTNLYSYTEPDFPVITHHWGAGLIFYLLWKAGGFTLVHLFFAASCLMAFSIFLWLAAKHSGLGFAALVSILVIPLLAERTEIRPEVFSYLFVAIFYLVLWLWQEQKISWKWLVILPLFELVWVNTHIYFFLGPLLIVAFLIQNALKTDKLATGRSLKIYIILLIATILATLVNPFGFRAVIEPFTILQDYGYRVLENQTVWFVQKMFSFVNTYIFEVVLGLLIISFILLLRKNRRAFSPALALLALGASLMGWVQIRNFALFALLALPIISYNFAQAFPRIVGRCKKISLTLLAIIVIIILSGNLTYLFPYWREFGMGLEQGNAEAAEFIQENKIAGPIFNNYDIGSYLIFYLYPKYRVFVDNRPEAYSVSFFQDIYIPMQENNEKWQGRDSRFQFNSIVFSYRDATPWGQAFLVSRIQDDEWVPVYVDQYVLIFIKNSDNNKSIIEKFAIPKSNFQIIQKT